MKYKNLILIAPPIIQKPQLYMFYYKFIKLLLENISSKNRILLIGGGFDLQEYRPPTHAKNLITIEIPTPPDIWIRDFAPVHGLKEDCKFRYAPAYYPKSERLFVKSLDDFGRQLLDRRIESSLILDGGNCVYNGENDIIVSNRVFKDNPRWSEEQIRTELQSKLNIKIVHIIDCEPGDVTGHTDGVVRFLQPNLLAVATFPEEYTENKLHIKEENYLRIKEYYNQVAAYFSSYYTVVRVTNGIPLNKKKEGIPSAIGNYINFLKFEDAIYLPQYGDETLDKAAYDTLLPYAKRIIPVNCNDLAEYGGVLNCITWET